MSEKVEKDVSSIFRNPINHIVFWSLLLIIFAARDLVWHNNIFHNILNQCVNFIFYIGISYLNIFYFIPKFWEKSKYILFSIVLLITIGIITFINSKIISYWLSFLGGSVASALFDSMEGYIINLTEVFLIVLISMSTYLIIQQAVKDKYAEELKKKNLETELQLLKSQINPHFLFNSLNSIYVHIPRTAVLARETLEKLSNLLSHQIYDIGQSKVPLLKDISHLKNYCAIEEIRNGDQVEFSMELGEEEELATIEVAPMLFLPFVENAFKHGKNSGKLHFFVKVQLHYQDNTLNFKCINSYEPEGYIPLKGGLGMTNVKRRLELSYPNRYSLELKDEDGIYEVNLKLKIHEY